MAPAKKRGRPPGQPPETGIFSGRAPPPNLESEWDLVGRECLRRARRILHEDVLRNADGRPVEFTGPDGLKHSSSLTLVEQVLQAVARAALTPTHPEQLRMAQLFLSYAVGMPDVLQARRTETTATTTEQPKMESLSAEDMAQRILQGVDIARDIHERSIHGRVITGIEVKCSVPEAPVAVLNIDVPAVPAEPVAPPVAPQVGIIRLGR